MNKYKTVKEVCDLTGLTRKHLYYFHHERVVRAVACANYSVEGYNGYKLYDDIAVEKLQQIALYYQLGLKRDEIKEIMLTPNYDSNMILHTLGLFVEMGFDLVDGFSDGAVTALFLQAHQTSQNALGENASRQSAYLPKYSSGFRSAPSLVLKKNSPLAEVDGQYIKRQAS